MNSASNELARAVAEGPSLLPRLPSRLRLLCAGPQEPSWVNLTLKRDAQRLTAPRFLWVRNPHSVLSVLRQETFDCILISDFPSLEDRFGHTDVCSVVRALRASGTDEPVVLVTAVAADALYRFACEFSCDTVVSRHGWDSAALVPVIRRAIGNSELLRENHHLSVAQRQRLVRERDEAEQLLNQQRLMLHDLNASKPADIDDQSEAPAVRPTDSQQTAVPTPAEADRLDWELPPEVNEYYHELLRTYVIMGSGSLGEEIARLADLMSVAGLRPREVMRLHLNRVESVVRGLGSRSTRHIMARADLLALELMMHLCECYRVSAHRNG